jgi:hypothetical protein
VILFINKSKYEGTTGTDGGACGLTGKRRKGNVERGKYRIK